MENFFGIMKSELLYAKEYTSMDSFITDLKEYMVGFTSKARICDEWHDTT